MVDATATKKYTVTLPEELAEAIPADIGAGGFSRYVTQAIERQRERDRLREAVDWWESEYGALTGPEMAEAVAERREIERVHADLSPERTGVSARSSGQKRRRTT